MGKLDLVIVSTGRDGQTRVIEPNNEWSVKDFVLSMAQEGYLDIKLVYVEDLEL